MVTCKKRECRKRSNLDADGYCVDHGNNNPDEPDCEKCGQCNADVPDNAETKAICCDAEDCKVWYHLDCTNISEALYELMNGKNDEDNGIRWLCPKCCRSDPVIKLVDAPSSTNPSTSVCNKLRHGICPHGISGKTLFKGKSCEFSHPKLCKKFIKNGPGGRYGCKSSETECPFFHPILCKSSVKARKCLNVKCTRIHLKGTVRKENLSSFPQLISYPQTYERQAVGYQQQKAWGEKQKQKPRNLYSRPVTVPQPPPENDIFLGSQPLNQRSHLSTLQAQVNRLEDLITKALLIRNQAMPNSLNLQDSEWPLIQHQSQFQGHHPQKWSS